MAEWWGATKTKDDSMSRLTQVNLSQVLTEVRFSDSLITK